ncbi:uncharacterized protein LOC100573315 [Acyrthosiphon pisum]|uniref:Uncharacterized protein n=1 Tax=Acyrthosiphon pisum TaxID=7029 RepID=A0A8R2NJH0_ACYPI|nr:uncharacterized protein LOC100573315 [Acyrthosiphon pisum]
MLNGELQRQRIGLFQQLVEMNDASNEQEQQATCELEMIAVWPFTGGPPPAVPYAVEGSIVVGGGRERLRSGHMETQISKNNDLEVDEPVYKLVNDNSDTSSTSDDNNYNNSDLENVLTFNSGPDDGEIADSLNENFDDIHEQLKKQFEKIVTDIVAQNIDGIFCVTHTLQLAVIDSLKGSTVEKLLKKMRVLVEKLRNQTYLYLIKKEKLKSPVLYYLTRWHSTVDMLEKVQCLRPFILYMSANDSKLNKLCISSFEWQQDALCKALLLFFFCINEDRRENHNLHYSSPKSFTTCQDINKKIAI